MTARDIVRPHQSAFAGTGFAVQRYIADLEAQKDSHYAWGVSQRERAEVAEKRVAELKAVVEVAGKLSAYLFDRGVVAVPQVDLRKALAALDAGQREDSA